MAKLHSYIHTKRTATPGSHIDKSLEHYRGDNSLCESHPEIAAQWHPHKNGNLTPDQVTRGSSKFIWWLCAKNKKHFWRTQVNTRTSYKTGCPYCSGRLASEENNLWKLYPQVAAQWHLSKNGVLTPDQCTPTSHRKIWWQCGVNSRHEWQAAVSNRVSQKSGCPYCAGKRVSSINRFSTKFPKLARDWHPVKNKKLRPEDVSFGSGQRVWWLCPIDDSHSWQTTVGDRTQYKTGCPFCANNKVCHTNSLATLYPELAKEWHPTKNKSLTPNDVTPGSNKKIWWQCVVDGTHVWLAKPNDRTSKGELGCAFCSHQRASRDYSLKKLYPNVAAQWHHSKNGKLKPEECTPASHKRVWWQCDINRSHVWQETIKHRTLSKTGCPYCSGKRVSSANQLSTLYPKIANEWHPTKNGKLTPADVSYGSGKNVWWLCLIKPSHAWQQEVKRRTISKSKCPYCYGA
jgi:positive regulator of sigma E activity